MRLRLAGAVALGALAFALPTGASAAPKVAAKDRTKSAGLEDFSHTHGANVDDYDGDGVLDAMVLRHYDSFPRLYLNDLGTFDEVRRRRTFIGSRKRNDYHACPSADVNRDGLLDFYCAIGGVRGTEANPNEFWLRRPNGTYVERAHRFGVSDRYGRSRAAVFLFANGDRWPDLYVPNDFPRPDGRRGPNKLFLNVGGKRFKRAPQWGVDGNIGGDAADVEDYDADGDDDLLLCANDGVRLFENRKRHFENITRSSGAAGRCNDADLERIDGDRRRDLMVLTNGSLRIFRQRPNGKFRSRPFVRKRVSKGAAFATGDANGDGRADVYVVRAAEYQEYRRRRAQVDVGDRMYLSRGRSRLVKKRVPQDNRGIGEAVTTIDYDQNGLDDFIVQNGWRMAYGPTRLVAFFPRGG